MTQKVGRSHEISAIAVVGYQHKAYSENRVFFFYSEFKRERRTRVLRSQKVRMMTTVYVSNLQLFQSIGEIWL
jgi:hypothetical protein